MKLTPGSSWSMFAKNGNDVTTLALTVARAQTGKKTVLVQPQGYHGAGPVWTKERLKFYLDPATFDSWLSTFSFVFFKKTKLNAHSQRLNIARSIRFFREDLVCWKMILLIKSIMNTITSKV